MNNFLNELEEIALSLISFLKTKVLKYFKA